MTMYRYDKNFIFTMQNKLLIMNFDSLFIPEISELFHEILLRELRLRIYIEIIKL